MIHYFSTNGIGNAWVANKLHGQTDAYVPIRPDAQRPIDAIGADVRSTHGSRAVTSGRAA